MINTPPGGGMIMTSFALAPYDEMEQIQDVVSSTEFASDLTNELSENDSDITVESVILNN